jgi:hypothetical protein
MARDLTKTTAKAERMTVAELDLSPAQLAADCSEAAKYHHATDAQRLAVIKMIREAVEAEPTHLLSPERVCALVIAGTSLPPLATDYQTYLQQFRALMFMTNSPQSVATKPGLLGVSESVCNGLVKLGYLVDQGAQGYTYTDVAKAWRKNKDRGAEDHKIAAKDGVEKKAPAAPKAPKEPKVKQESELVRQKKPRTSGFIVETRKIKVVAKKNPSREGTKAHDFFEMLKKSKTVADYTKLGGSQNYLIWFFDRGAIEIK